MTEANNLNYEKSLERCPICGRTTKLMLVRDFLEEPWIVDCVCDCDDIQQEQRQKEMQKAASGLQNDFFYNLLKEPKGKRAVFENDDLKDTKTTDYCKRYVNEFHQKLKLQYSQYRKGFKGVVFIGDTGVGKSFFAACIGNALINNGYTVLETNLPRLAADVGFNDYGEKLKQLKQYQLLIIDDWGIERKTEIMDELLQVVIDERYRQELPIILTSNRTVKQMIYPEDEKDHRILSRLCEMAEVVHVKGQDRRMISKLYEGITA